MVQDREDKNERTIVEVPQQGYKEMAFSDITPDGRYGICQLTYSENLIDAYCDAQNGIKPPRIWDAIGIITLPEPK